MSQHDDRLVRRVAEAAAGRHPDGPCPDAEVLGLYAERGLDDEYGRVEAHVAGCARCQATVAAFVRSAPEAAEVAGGGQGAGGVQRWWMGWRWLAPVAATAAVAMVAVSVGRGPSEQAAESAPAEAVPTISERASAPAERFAPPQPPSGVVARSDAGSPPAPREEADARPAQRAPASPATSALGASEARFERAQPERQREVEARRDAATDQFRAAAVPPAPAEPAAPPPPAPVAVPAPAETLAASPAGAAVADGRGARATAGNDAAAAGALAKATAAGSQRMANLTGRVTYRTRQALPAGAAIVVQLLDVSRMEVPAPELGRIAIVTKGEQVPVPFAIRYDANAIDARRRYTVQATITIEGRVAFRTTTAHLVLTNGGSSTDVEVVVEPQR